MSEKEEWVRLYHAINQLMLKLAIAGSVRIGEFESEAVMGALHEIDGGEWNTNLGKEPFREELL